MPTLRNGRLPASTLLAIPWDPAEHVRSYALPSLVALNTAFRARFGHNLIINEGYRDYATQERYYDDPPSGVGTAAWPGTSNHGWGLAVDLKLRGGEYAWMLANAPRFGWVNPLWARDGKGVEEPWHWEHVGAPAVVPHIIGGDAMPSIEEVQQMVVGVLRAPEFDLSRGRAFEVISGWYIDLLGRAGSPAEVKSHVDLIVSSRSTYDVIYAGIYGSDEAKAYRARKPATTSAPVIDYAALAKAILDDLAATRD